MPRSELRKDRAGVDEDDATIEGPVVKRACTDRWCLLICLGYSAALIVLALELREHSYPSSVTHGHDYLGRTCGLDDGVESLPCAYYPDLERDFATKKGYLADTYGLCLDACPKAWSILHDYPDSVLGNRLKERRKERWYVAWPSLPLFGRCLPYQDRRMRDKGLMCAWPACDPALTCRGEDDIVCQARKRCGPIDGEEDMSTFWYIEPPRGPRLHTQAAADVPNPRMQELLDICEVKVNRQFTLSVLDDHGVLAKLMTRYSGHVFQAAGEVRENWQAIALIGLLGSLCWSMVLVRGFAACLRVVMFVFVALLFIGLCLLDYILFVKAGKISPRYGLGAYKLFQEEFKMIPGTEVDLGSRGEELFRSFGAAEDPRVQNSYGYVALILLIAIGAFACIWVKCQKNMKVIVALASEAAQALWRMPTLIIFPVIIIVSLSACCCALLYMFVCILTLKGSALQSDPDELQTSLLLLVAFSFLWAWFFHMAITATTVAGSISQWFFYRQDASADHGTFHVWFAFLRAMRYHLGSMALGSFLIALTKVPRLILMYIEMEMGQVKENNGALACVVRISQCCIWCFERFLKELGCLAYLHIAIAGKDFCPSAHAAFVLVAKWPVQMWFNAMATEAIHWLVVLLVPTLNILLSLMVIKRGQFICTCFVAVLSASVASITVSVFDTTLSTMFMCAARDEEYHQGRYSPNSLRMALELPERETKAHDAGIEMRGREVDLGE